MSTAMTSMKVEPSVRDRVSVLAQAQGYTVSRTIAGLLDEHDRRERFAAVAAAYDESDPEYLADVAIWDNTLADGLDCP